MGDLGDSGQVDVQEVSLPHIPLRSTRHDTSPAQGEEGEGAEGDTGDEGEGLGGDEGHDHAGGGGVGQPDGAAGAACLQVPGGRVERGGKEACQLVQV